MEVIHLPYIRTCTVYLYVREVMVVMSGGYISMLGRDWW